MHRDSIGVDISLDRSHELARSFLLIFLDWVVSFGLLFLLKYDDGHHFDAPGAIAATSVLYAMFYAAAAFVIRQDAFHWLCFGLNFAIRFFVMAAVFEAGYIFAVFLHCGILLGMLTLTALEIGLKGNGDANYRGFILSQNLNLVMMLVTTITSISLARDCNTREMGEMAGGYLVAYLTTNYFVAYDRTIHQLESRIDRYSVDSIGQLLSHLYFNPFPIVLAAWRG